MRFLDEIQFSDNESGIGIVVKLAEGWKTASKNFPSKRIGEILKPSIIFANNRLKELKQEVELTAGEYGLHHISLLPGRAGIDLFPKQNQYISHNLSRPHQVAAVLAVVMDYLKLLEYIKPGAKD